MLRTDGLMNLAGQVADEAGQLGVGLGSCSLVVKVVIGFVLLNRRLPVLADHDERRQNMAFRAAMSVKVGRGLFATHTIQMANRAVREDEALDQRNG